MVNITNLPSNDKANITKRISFNNDISSKILNQDNPCIVYICFNCDSGKVYLPSQYFIFILKNEHHYELLTKKENLSFLCDEIVQFKDMGYNRQLRNIVINSSTIAGYYDENNSRVCDLRHWHFMYDD